jgi:integrase
MREVYPFKVFKRANKPSYYVCFKNETTGDYLSPISTKQKTKAEAIKQAFVWLRDGIPQRGKTLDIQDCLLRDMAKKSDVTEADAAFIVKELQRKGLLKAAVLTGSKQDIDFVEYLLNFWDYDNSPYIKEKLRKQHGIHRSYCKEMLGVVKKYWVSSFSGRLLGSITRQDIESFVNMMGNVSVSAKQKNKILRAGTIALKWAYNKDLFDCDVTKGIVWYSGKSNERNILTPETVQALFAHTWHDGTAKLANMVACFTGMRAGEILALRGIDLGTDCLYVRHSWNDVDRLKTPKNNEERTVQLPFPLIMAALVEHARSNPHGQGTEGFVFYSELPDKPFDEHVLLKKLRGALVEIGLSVEGARQYTFHGWRHFYSSYMAARIDAKLLMTQTGHKTEAMIKGLYGAHRIAGDVERIEAAQIEQFSALLPATIETGKHERERDAHGHYTGWHKGE